MHAMAFVMLLQTTDDKTCLMKDIRIPLQMHVLASIMPLQITDDKRA